MNIWRSVTIPVNYILSHQEIVGEFSSLAPIFRKAAQKHEP